MAKDVAPTLFLTNKAFLLMALQQAGVTIKTRHRLTEIAADSVLTTDGEGNESRIPADAVVLAMGVRPRDNAAQSFEDAFSHVTRIGDAEKTGQIADALRMAHDKATVF